jgi:hypothetical protein
MLRWPIRLKLIVGLSVVVGMMLILMGASIFGLHSFHMSYLTLVDQLRELGASAELIESVFRLHAPREGTDAEMEELHEQVVVAQDALGLFSPAEEKHQSGERVDDSTDDSVLPSLSTMTWPPFARTRSIGDHCRFPVAGHIFYVRSSRALPPINPPPHQVTLSGCIHRDATAKALQRLWQVLRLSPVKYQTSRVIVWVSALMVLAMLCGLMFLFQMGSVSASFPPARGSPRGTWLVRLQDQPRSGDEMRTSPRPNDMTAKISMTYPIWATGPGRLALVRSSGWRESVFGGRSRINQQPAGVDCRAEARCRRAIAQNIC